MSRSTSFPACARLARRGRPALLAAAALLGLASAAHSQQTPGPRPVESDAHPAIQETFARGDRGYQDFLARTPGPWRALYDEDWGRPISIVGKGIPVPAGPVADLAAARAVAEGVLATYPDLWQVPVSQLKLANEVKTGQLYVFTWRQEFDGLAVRGARVRIQVHEAGRVASIHATSTPLPVGFSRAAKVTAESAQGIVAAGKVLLAGDSVSTDDLLVFVAAKVGVRVPRLAWQVTVEQPSRDVHEHVFVDANDGSVLLVEPTKWDLAQGAQGNVKAVIHDGLTPNTTFPGLLGGARVQLQVFGLPWSTVYTDSLGNYSDPSLPSIFGWSATVDLAGSNYHVVPATGAAYTFTQFFSGSTGDMLLNSSPAPLDTAQLTSAVLFNVIDAYIKTRVPSFGGIPNFLLNPNHTNYKCNAYGGKGGIEFCVAGGSCPDTCYSTVLYHEFGHAVDDWIGGIQSGALSEAIGDIFAMYQTGQQYIGQDFYGANTYIRAGNNATTWPAKGCSGEVHCVGETFMGFAWISRNSLINAYGFGPGVAAAENAFLGILPVNNSSILDAVDQVFLNDDNDGDLSNGTPHYFELYNAAVVKGFKTPIPPINYATYDDFHPFPNDGTSMPYPPKSPKLGDMNGDGMLDFLFCSESAKVLGGAYGDGMVAGRYPQPWVPTNIKPTEIVLGDFNSDSKLDVAVASGVGEPAGMDIMVSLAAGGFTSSGMYCSGKHLNKVVAADVNLDGKLDLVGLHPEPKCICLLGDGAGGFSGPFFFDGGSSPQGLAVGDLNGDGHPDIATSAGGIAGSAGGSIQVLLGGVPGGLFGLPTAFPTADPMGEIAIGQIQYEGFKGVIALSPTAGSLSLLPGDGLGNLGSPVFLGGGLNQPTSLALGDAGGDGVADVLMTESGDAASGTPGNLVLFTGGVKGPTCGFEKFPAGLGPRGIALGDINHDGRLDAVVANELSSNLAIYLNGLPKADPAFATPYGTGTPGCGGTLALAAPIDPKVGESGFHVLCSNAPSNSLGLGIVTNAIDLNGSDAFGIGVKLHVDLFNASEIYTADFLSDEVGQGRAAMPIPNNPFIGGHTYYMATLWLGKPGYNCSPSIFHLVSSKGLILVIKP